MKYLKLFICLLLLFTACNSRQISLAEDDKGIEIYKVKLKWDTLSNGWRNKIMGYELASKATPVIKYDEIISLERKSHLDYSRKELAFTLSKPVDKILTLGNNQNFKADSGFIVTLNEEVIYTAYYKTRFASDYDTDVLFFILGKSFPNSFEVFWDSLAKDRFSFRNEPDPRYDPHLLNRLRQDGKLKK